MSESNIILTGRNGEIDGTSTAQLDEVRAGLLSTRSAVIHLHGGLVDEAAGMEKASRLRDFYLTSGSYPVFLVWRSGLIEVLRNNLTEIMREDLFRRILKRVVQFSVGKLRQSRGERAVGALLTPHDPEVLNELALREIDQEPYVDFVASTDISPMTEPESQQLQFAIEADPLIRAALDELLANRHPETAQRGIRGPVVRRKASDKSLIDPEVIDELDPGETPDRGIVSAAILARKCAAALQRVIHRFRAATDHGLYPTVIEELLREFYFSNAGGSVWSAIKAQTQSTFHPTDNSTRGGRFLLEVLVDAIAANPDMEITLVGHSTGAVYINHLLNEVNQGRTENYRPWPAHGGFRVASLAPACTHVQFASTLDGSQNLIKQFRMFTMDDPHERADRLVGAVYPRSLLYFVSGVLERDDRNSSTVNPILGMARYLEPRVDNLKALSRCKAFLVGDRTVLSPTSHDAPEGMRSGAVSHTDFDKDDLVLESLATMMGRS